MAQRVFFTRSGTASFSCPECGETKRLDVAKFKDIQKEVRLKCTCKCKHVFSVILERRQHVRKEVFLEGVVLVDQKKYPMHVINISRYGLRIRLKRPLNIKVNDKVNIEFVLDDATRSYVRKTLLARIIHGNELGLEFVDSNHYDKLGSYLLFHFA